jgi:hypothetical protein
MGRGLGERSWRTVFVDSEKLAQGGKFLIVNLPEVKSYSVLFNGAL